MCSVPSLPSVRQRTRSASVMGNTQTSAQENLARAFMTFTQAAGSLEKSYTQLHAEVARLHVELQRANSELERSLEENARMRNYLASVLENLPCGVIVVGGEGRLQIINPEARRLLDVPASWMPSVDGSVPPIFRRLSAEIRGDGFFVEQETTIAGVSGNRCIGILRGNISENSGVDAETIWILRDITEQKRVAGEREATRRSGALAEIAAVLAHEIRNPLGSMELFTGLLADATAHLPETRQWITHLQAGLRALSATVNNVLQFHSQVGAQMLPVELDRLVNETLDFLQPMARQRGQKIKIENSVGKLSSHADSNRLKQVFLNLALNAFRAMQPGGTLEVRLRWAPQFPGGVAEIEFKDDGRGIAPELVERIFEPGFTTTPGSPGLGLAVCKRVVEQHGGEIAVQSKPQHGARFAVLLPVSGGV